MKKFEIQIRQSKQSCPSCSGHVFELQSLHESTIRGVVSLMEVRKLGSGLDNFLFRFVAPRNSNSQVFNNTIMLEGCCFFAPQDQSIGRSHQHQPSSLLNTHQQSLGTFGFGYCYHGYTTTTTWKRFMVGKIPS